MPEGPLELRSTLSRLDRKGYGAYRDLRGAHDFGDLGKFTLYIDRVQRDPFAPPSLARARTKINDFDPRLFEGRTRRIALEDYLTRRVESSIERNVSGRRGSGGSGKIEVQSPSQVVLERTSVVVAEDYVEARIGIGLPASGRSVDARAATEMLFEELPRVVGESLLSSSVDAAEARFHVETVEDAEHLRGLLPGLGLVAFVADGAVLPRESGASERPLQESVTPFESPEELCVQVNLPNRGRVFGMGVPEGVTLIAGGGFHGKSTLLEAISLGVYDHVPGDGRELVVSRADAVKVRAEDGRSVAGVDISAMIGDLPGARSTTSFSTQNASGSTSQAANIAEAIEVGTTLLLVDEDTSATNFMVRDERMRALVAREPITPFIDVVGPLYRDLGVSTIIVVGGVGDYLEAAERVVLLEDYHPSDATRRAREVREEFPPRGTKSKDLEARRPAPRSLDPSGVDLRRGKRERARGRGPDTIELGRERVDLSCLEQLAESGQTEAVARIIGGLVGSGVLDLHEGVERALEALKSRGLDSLGGFEGHPGQMSRPRAQEVAAAISRIRTLRAG